MSTHNIGFYEDLTKIIFQLSSNTRLISSSVHFGISNRFVFFLFQELYYKYSLNNFLHTHVTVCIYTILNNPPIEVEDKKECPLLEQVCYQQGGDFSSFVKLNLSRAL